MRRLLDAAGGDVGRALAFYNAGQGGAAGPPSTWPAETRAYVAAVLARAGLGGEGALSAGLPPRPTAAAADRVTATARFHVPRQRGRLDHAFPTRPARGRPHLDRQDHRPGALPGHAGPAARGGRPARRVRDGADGARRAARGDVRQRPRGRRRPGRAGRTVGGRRRRPRAQRERRRPRRAPGARRTRSRPGRRPGRQGRSIASRGGLHRRRPGPRARAGAPGQPGRLPVPRRGRRGAVRRQGQVAEEAGRVVRPPRPALERRTADLVLRIAAIEVLVDGVGGRGAAAGAEPRQDAPAVVQRAAARRQVVPVHRGDPAATAYPRVMFTRERTPPRACATSGRTPARPRCARRSTR